MKDFIKETPATDEVALIELGSVSEETRGDPGIGEELVQFYSREQA